MNSAKFKKQRGERRSLDIKTNPILFLEQEKVIVNFRQLRERLEQENGVGKRTSSEGDTGENLSKVGY